MSLTAVKAFFHRILIALIGPSRVVLGMLAFLSGFLTAAGGALYALFGAGVEVTHYLRTTSAPDFVDLLVAAAIGAWVGAVIFCIGLALLWASRRLDPNGAVRTNKAVAHQRRAVR